MTHWTKETARAAAESYQCLAAAIEDVSTEEGAFDHVIADPPYSPRTQNNTRRGRKSDHTIDEAMLLGFDPLTIAKVERWAQWMARSARGWIKVFSDHETSMIWANALVAAGADYIRPMLWIRTGDVELSAERPAHSGAPQFTGDRPATGHEVIVLAHAGRTKMRWNSHGRTGIYPAPVVTGTDRVHTTQKPLSLMMDLVHDFVREGETVVDPFAGSGTTLAACKYLRVPCAGIELDKKHASYAARRAASATPLERHAKYRP